MKLLYWNLHDGAEMVERINKRLAAQRHECTSGMVWKRVRLRDLRPKKPHFVIVEVWEYEDHPQLGEFETGVIHQDHYILRRLPK